MPPLPLVAATESVVTLFAFITLLGDAWFLLVGLSLLYWGGPHLDDTTRPVGATVIALATLALAVVLAVKSYTAIPRPAAAPITTSGWGVCKTQRMAAISASSPSDMLSKTTAALISSHVKARSA